MSRWQAPEASHDVSTSSAADKPAPNGEEHTRKRVSGRLKYFATPAGKQQWAIAMAMGHAATRAISHTPEFRARMRAARALAEPALAAWNVSPAAKRQLAAAAAKGRAAQATLRADDTPFRRQMVAHLANNRSIPGFAEHQKSRRLDAAAAKRLATQARVLALDDAGRSRSEIAAALDLSVGHVCRVLRHAGRPFVRRGKSRAHKPWRQQRAEERAARIAAKQQAREARAEQSAARQARVAALNDAGATPAEIAAELGLNVGSVRNILARIGTPRQDKERAAQVRARSGGKRKPMAAYRFGGLQVTSGESGKCP